MAAGGVGGGGAGSAGGGAGGGVRLLARGGERAFSARLLGSGRSLR